LNAAATYASGLRPSDHNDNAANRPQPG